MCNSEDSESDDGSDISSDEGKHAKARKKRSANEHDKKPVKLDPNGIPYGNMREVLAADIKRYAKDLDPTTSWEGQPGGQRRRFFRRLYSGTATAFLSFLCRLYCQVGSLLTVVGVVL